MIHLGIVKTRSLKNHIPETNASTTLTETTMTMPNQRTIFRWIHIVFAIPILGYIYSPFEKLPGYAAPTRYVIFPLMVLTELWMWKGHLVRKLVAKRPVLSTNPQG